MLRPEGRRSCGRHYRAGTRKAGKRSRKPTTVLVRRARDPGLRFRSLRGFGPEGALGTVLRNQPGRREPQGDNRPGTWEQRTGFGRDAARKASAGRARRENAPSGARAPSRYLSLPSETGFAPAPAERRTPRGLRLRPRLPRGFPRFPRADFGGTVTMTQAPNRRRSALLPQVGPLPHRGPFFLRGPTPRSRPEIQHGLLGREIQGQGAKTIYRSDLRRRRDMAYVPLEPRGGSGSARLSRGSSRPRHVPSRRSGWRARPVERARDRALSGVVRPAADRGCPEGGAPPMSRETSGRDGKRCSDLA